MQTVKLIFPNQLFRYNPLVLSEGPVYLIEEYLYFRQYCFHKQKIAFHRASMKFYEDYLQQRDIQVRYIESEDTKSDIRILLKDLHGLGHRAVALIDPVDDWLMGRIQKACGVLGLQLEVLDSPMFLNARHELQFFLKPGQKTFYQTAFYKQERIRRNILMDEDDATKPAGGKWTFDDENRKRYPKGKPVVRTEFPASDMWFKEAVEYTNRYFSDHFGCLSDAIHYPNSFDAAEKWLNQFLQTRFAEFGHYEDAIKSSELLLNHSLLTPMLNVGLLTPDEVLNQVLLYSKTTQIPINSLEGFVRQIIGWREFIRGVYVARGREQRLKNFWGFDRKIPKCFYEGNTGILPVDISIKKVLETGYCHHIERLMVLGNFMMLCEFNPDEVYKWFMEMFIDSYDWVMVPNVYGMSQFADGGIMSTKPYLSGSNYLMKMGDYPKGDWQKVWDALFWRFLDKQRAYFLKNPRLSMLLRTFDKWDTAKKTAVLKTANDYLAGLTMDID